MEFEWDPAKDEANQQKHGISFSDASEVFGDPVARTVADPRHSIGESRYVTLGFTFAGRLLVVAHTARGERVRIITARDATPRERKSYEYER